MNPKERKKLAAEIVEEIKINGCPHGIDAETAAGLKEFAKAYKDTRITLRRAIIVVIVGGGISIVVAGVIAKIKNLIP
jgi:mitochondrial fission protein ELM1